MVQYVQSERKRSSSTLTYTNIKTTAGPLSIWQDASMITSASCWGTGTWCPSLNPLTLCPSASVAVLESSVLPPAHLLIEERRLEADLTERWKKFVLITFETITKKKVNSIIRWNHYHSMQNYAVHKCFMAHIWRDFWILELKIHRCVEPGTFTKIERNIFLVCINFDVPGISWLLDAKVRFESGPI